MNRFPIKHDNEFQISVYSSIHPYKDGKYLARIDMYINEINEMSPMSIYLIDNKIEEVLSPRTKFSDSHQYSSLVITKEKIPLIEIYERDLTGLKQRQVDLFTKEPLERVICTRPDHGIGYARVGNKGISTCGKKANDESIGRHAFEFFLPKEDIKHNEVILFNFYEGQGFSYKIMEIFDKESEVLNVAISYDQLTAACLVWKNRELEVVVIDLE